MSKRIEIIGSDTPETIAIPIASRTVKSPLSTPMVLNPFAAQEALSLMKKLSLDGCGFSEMDDRLRLRCGAKQ